MWTLYQGEVYVACQLDCQTSMLGLVPPPVGDRSEAEQELLSEMELPEGGGAKPLEGSAANGSEDKYHEWPF